MTITQAIALSVEELQEMNMGDLSTLHKQLSESKQKKAQKKADLVAGIIQGKKKAEKSEPKQEQPQPQQEELELVENSTKAPVKPKAPKGATKPKPKAGTKPQPKKPEPKQEEQPEEQPKSEEQPKKPAPSKKPAPTKKPSGKKPAPKQKKPEEMTQAELLALYQQQQEELEKQKSSLFPPVIEGDKIKFEAFEFETVKDVQKQLIESPYSTFVFMEESRDELTQFLVLFMNEDVTVLLDRNYKKDTTITVKTADVKPETMKIKKQDFRIRFYTKKVK